MDREKVIKGMRMCISPVECSPDDCPYYIRPNNESGLCWDRLMTDALALIKEQQEAVEPKKENDGNPEPWTTWWYVCGDCGQPIDKMDRYCRRCGKQVKWK